MKYLLDTNVLIWCFDDPYNLSSVVLDIIKNTENTFYISIASLWEIAIKLSIKKLDTSISLNRLNDLIKKKNIKILPIKQKYLKIILHLPMYHKDPFDRLFIATAIAEEIPIITSDRDIHHYEVNWIW